MLKKSILIGLGLILMILTIGCSINNKEEQTETKIIKNDSIKYEVDISYNKENRAYYFRNINYEDENNYIIIDNYLDSKDKTVLSTNKNISSYDNVKAVSDNTNIKNQIYKFIQKRKPLSSNLLKEAMSKLEIEELNTLLAYIINLLKEHKAKNNDDFMYLQNIFENLLMYIDINKIKINNKVTYLSIYNELVYSFYRRRLKEDEGKSYIPDYNRDRIVKEYESKQRLKYNHNLKHRH